jgi:hypothetical protein
MLFNQAAKGCFSAIAASSNPAMHTNVRAVETFSLKRFLVLLVFALLVAVSSLALNQLVGFPFISFKLAIAIGLVIILASFLIYAKSNGVLMPKRMIIQKQRDRIALLSEFDQLPEVLPGFEGM